MQVGGRRVVGAALAAGLLVGGMALGAGTASADTCTDSNGDTYTGLASLITGPVCDPDLIARNLITKVTPPADATPQPSKETTDEPAPAKDTPTLPELPALPGSENPPAPAPGPTRPAGSGPTVNAGAGAGAGAGGGQATGAPAVGQATPTGGVLASGPPAVAGSAAAFGAQPGGVLPTDLTGTAFAPALMAAGIYDPALLLGPGAPTASLQTVGPNPASAVTSASQVQAMALNAPAPLGIGAMVGVVILAGLGGLVLRHRLMRRAKNAASS